MELIKSYDFIENITVSMFQTALYKNGDIYNLLGCNNKFKIGDKLKMDSLCYKYKKSCIIVDYNRRKEGFYGIIVKNEIVFDYKKIEKEDFAEIEAIYLPTGEELLIEYFEEFAVFLEAENEYNRIKNDYAEKYNELLILFQEKAETDDLYFINNKYKLDEIDEFSKELINSYEDTWIKKTTNDNIKYFGVYLSCLVNKTSENLNKLNALEILGKKKNVKAKIENTLNEGEVELGVIKDKFSNFLSINHTLNKDYLDWLNLENTVEDESERDLIKGIVENIHYHLES